jgi:hypothetical protein
MFGACLSFGSVAVLGKPSALRAGRSFEPSDAAINAKGHDAKDNGLLENLRPDVR